VLSIVVEYFGDQSKINNRELFSLQVVANILKLQITMCIPYSVYDFQLGDQLHAHIGDSFIVEAVVQHGVLQTLIYFEVFKNVFTYI
jgi:hypothetical protein